MNTTRDYWTSFFPIALLSRLFAVPTRPRILPPDHRSHNCTDLERREFAAVLSSGSWIAPVSFKSDKEWTGFLKRRDVNRIEIGPCLDNTSSLRATQTQQDRGITENYEGEAFDPDIKPVGTELRFDIDADDIDRVRGCCRGKKTLCEMCWFLCLTTARTLDTILRTRFFYKHVMWVFSGRRGVHAWVCDPKAVELSTAGRKHVFDTYSALSLHIDTLVEKNAIEARTAASADFVREEDAFFQSINDLIEETLMPAFDHAVEKNIPMFYTEERLAQGPTGAKLRMVFSEAHAEGTAELGTYYGEGVWILFAACVTPLLAESPDALKLLENRYSGLCELGDEVNRENMTLAGELRYISILVRETLRRCPHWEETEEEVMHRIRRRLCLALLARLDAPVTLQIGHKLKIPFSLHPSTGRIGMPFLLDTKWSNPCVDAPCAADLTDKKELSDLDALFEEPSAWDRHVEILREFVTRLEKTRESHTKEVKERLRRIRSRIGTLQKTCADRMNELNAEIERITL